MKNSILLTFFLLINTTFSQDTINKKTENNQVVLKEINPYIYLSLIFVFISFLLHLGIFILLLRNKSFI